MPEQAPRLPTRLGSLKTNSPHACYGSGELPIPASRANPPRHGRACGQSTDTAAPAPLTTSPRRDARPPPPLSARAPPAAGTGPGGCGTRTTPPAPRPTRDSQVGERVGAQRRRQRAHPVRVALRHRPRRPPPPPAALPPGRRLHPRPGEPGRAGPQRRERGRSRGRQRPPAPLM